MSGDSRSWRCESWTLFTSPGKAVAEERDRGNGHPPRVRVRVWSTEEGKYLRKSLGMTVRDDDGDIDPDLVAEMQRKGKRVAEDLLEGIGDDEPVVRGPQPAQPASELTLKEGFRLAFLPKKEGGKYRDGRYRSDAARARDDILRILSPARTWTTLKRSDYERIWETIAEVRTGEREWRSDKLTGDDGRGKLRTPGWAWCEKMLSTLFAVGHWLEDEGHLRPETIRVPNRWKRTLKAEWRKLTDESTRPDKPRYTPAEAGRLLQALPQADPRLRLALKLGAEDRLGQVLRARRSHLDLSPVGEFGAGRIDIVGRGNKRGEMQDLDPDQRAEIDRALGPDGYLCGLEAAYREGRREDYPLFPANAFRDGIRTAPMNAPDKPMSPRTMRSLFNELEKDAGVEHREGRGWYGLRRLAADLAPDYTSHAGVLNNLGHWADSRTRESYQQAFNPAITGKAARVRRQMRNDLRVKAEEDLTATPAEQLEELIFASGPEVFGSLLQSLGTLDPAKALGVLKTARSGGLQTVDSDAVLSELTEADLMPLLKADDPDVRAEAASFLAMIE